MIHYMKGTEEKHLRTTTTGCNVRGEDLPRKDAYVFYSNRAKVDCPTCLAKIAKIKTMRGE